MRPTRSVRRMRPSRPRRESGGWYEGNDVCLAPFAGALSGSRTGSVCWCRPGGANGGDDFFFLRLGRGAHARDALFFAAFPKPAGCVNSIVCVLLCHTLGRVPIGASLAAHAAPAGRTVDAGRVSNQRVHVGCRKQRILQLVPQTSRFAAKQRGCARHAVTTP